MFLKNLKTIKIETKPIFGFAYAPKIKFLGPRALLPKKEAQVKKERVLQDIIRPNMEVRKEFSTEEVDVINQGGQTMVWKKIKKIKIVKEEDDD